MKACFERENIKSPEYYTKEEIQKMKKIPYPILGKLVYGSRGRGMVKIDDKESLTKYLQENKSKRIYFEKYYSGSREYRLHISDLGCFYTCRKLRRSSAEQRWYFNSSNCNWILETNPSFDKPDTWDDIVEECIKAKNAVGLDFAAVDVRVNKEGDFRIIETNSAPSLGDIGLEKYEKHLPELLKHKYDN